MSMRSNGPIQGSRQHLRRGLEPVRQANQRVKIATRGILSVYRILSVAILAAILGITLAPEKKELPDFVTAEQAFNLEPRDQDNQCGEIRRRFGTEEQACSKAITGYLRTNAPNPLDSGPKPKGIVLQGLRQINAITFRAKDLWLTPPPGAKIYIPAIEASRDVEVTVNGVSARANKESSGWSAPVTDAMLEAGDGMIGSVEIVASGLTSVVTIR